MTECVSNHKLERDNMKLPLKRVQRDYYKVCTVACKMLSLSLESVPRSAQIEISTKCRDNPLRSQRVQEIKLKRDNDDKSSKEAKFQMFHEPSTDIHLGGSRIIPDHWS